MFLGNKHRSFGIGLSALKRTPAIWRGRPGRSRGWRRLPGGGRGAAIAGFGGRIFEGPGGMRIRGIRKHCPRSYSGRYFFQQSEIFITEMGIVQ